MKRTLLATCLLLLLIPCLAAAATLQLPKTGQTACYDAAGTVIDCAGTGQDGALQKGAAWPDPRFTDNSNGTVTDNLTGLIWLKNANCWGAITWQTALNNANSLVGNNTLCSLNDGSAAGAWRLPNRKELQSLIDRSTVNPALPAGHPFTGVQSDFYWSSSTVAGYTDGAWLVSMVDGYVNFSNKDFNYYVWPVRAGQ